MNYYIKRDLNEYGPYTLADLQRYVAQGNIVLTDLARGNGMTDWVPVSQILASTAPAPPLQTQPALGAATSAAVATQPAVVQPGAMQPGMAYPGVPMQAVPGLVPPDFHWALVLVIGFFCNIFTYVWLFIEAGFVKKLKAQSNFMALLIGSIVLMFGTMIPVYVIIIGSAVNGSSEFPWTSLSLLGVGELAAAVLYWVAVFQMRDALQQYYNTVEPINLRLSGVMTFFFAVYYFQHHFSRIAQWKKTGILQPQG